MGRAAGTQGIMCTGSIAGASSLVMALAPSIRSAEHESIVQHGTEAAAMPSGAKQCQAATWFSPSGLQTDVPDMRIAKWRVSVVRNSLVSILVEGALVTR